MKLHLAIDHDGMLPAFKARFLREAQMAQDLSHPSIVKGLKAPGWPLQGWAALHRLAQALSQACRAPAAEKMRKSAA